jgi:hypothetical protein
MFRNYGSVEEGQKVSGSRLDKLGRSKQRPYRGSA